MVEGAGRNVWPFLTKHKDVPVISKGFREVPHLELDFKDESEFEGRRRDDIPSRRNSVSKGVEAAGKGSGGPEPTSLTGVQGA